MRRFVLLAFAVAVQAVSLVPPNARCAAVQSAEEVLPIWGLDATNPPRQCLTARAAPSSKPGAVVQRYRLPNIPAGETLQFFLWNHRRKPDNARRTTVEFTGGNGQKATGIATVNQQGEVTGITITNPGHGYTSVPTCTISFNRFSPEPPSKATCVAILGGSGSVTSAVVTAAGTGYPPSVGTDFFTGSGLRFELISRIPGEGPTHVNLTSTHLPRLTDSARCPCADPYAAACSCIPQGFSSAAVSVPCGAEAYVEVEATVETDYAIAARRATSVPQQDLPTIPLGQKTQFFTLLGGNTQLKIDANGTDFVQRYAKELRVTLETPLEANWACHGGPDTDCSVPLNRLAGISIDTEQIRRYEVAPTVRIDPPRRGIQRIVVTDGGNYTSPPSVAIARQPRQQVAAVKVLSGGRGYVRPPRVHFDGTGVAAEATAVINAEGVVTRVDVVSGGNYTGGRPAVQFRAAMELEAIHVTNTGSGYNPAGLPVIIFTPPSAPDGETIQATPNIDGHGGLASFTITNPGRGYYDGDQVRMEIARRIYAVDIDNPGSNYTEPPTVTFSYTTGSCEATEFAKGAAVLSPTGQVERVEMDLSVFRACTASTNFVVTFSEPTTPGGTRATGVVKTSTGTGMQYEMKWRLLYDQVAIAVAEMNPERSEQPRNAILRAVLGTECGTDTRVVAVEVLDPGSDYSPEDVVSFSSGEPNTASATLVVEPAGVDATATASLDSDKFVNAVTVTRAGSGYNAASPPFVKLFGMGRVLRIKVRNPGSGYTAPPRVRIDGPANSRARATATVENGRLTAITVTDPGAWHGASYSDGTVHITPRFEIREIELTNRGSGYDPANPPRVWIRSAFAIDAASAVAEVSPSGCLSAIRVTNPGSAEYADWTVTIDPPPSGSGTTATATATVGSGQDATAEAVIERDDAEAEAIVNAAGAVSGITVTRKGVAFGEGGYPLPEITTNPVYNGLSYTMELNDVGLPTGRVHIRGTSSTTQSGSVHAFVWPASHGLVARATKGAGVDLGSHSTAMFRLVTYGSPTSYTRIPPARIEYTPTKKTFAFDLAARALSTQPFYYLHLAAPADGSRRAFPSSEFVSNSAFGADNPLNAMFLPASVTVEVIEYPELYQKGPVSGSISPNEPVIYQISLPHNWSKINITYTATDLVLKFRFRWTANVAGCSANQWCTIDEASMEMRRRGGAEELLYAPNTHVPPANIEVSVASCNGAGRSTFDFKLEVVVTEYDTEGECGATFDCQAGPGRAHPTPHSRVALSVNGNQARFDKCFTDSRPGLLHNGICVECTADCDCPLGQYCHTDTGTESIEGLGLVLVDTWSAERYGTCQRKDTVGDILGKPCRTNYANNMVEYGQPGRNTQQLCGKAFFYNDSHVENNRRGDFRRSLWTGTCINHVCYECASEGSTTCSGRRICVDGFWQEKSGNSLQGAHTAAQTSAIKDAVSDGNAVTGTMLAFVILIAVGMGVTFFLLRKGK